MDYSGNESSESDTSLSSDSEIQGGSEFSFNSTSFLGGVELFDLEDGGSDIFDEPVTPSVTPNTTPSVTPFVTSQVTPKSAEERSVSSSASIIYEGGSDIEDSSPLFESDDEELECELKKLLGRVKIE